ncbi:cytochrome c family protein [Ahrensia sp. R2A130]|uniref:c-type cytochrome n=1 Tax=Ahrensia sp. R2A130 TaxID=744979 RepID=UPI0001E08C79|nr:c-type cytochrome [Ahrensia sp. R2A130]EFL89102.1 cytochrome c2 [Ahrensia sp. R2A130]
MFKTTLSAAALMGAMFVSTAAFADGHSGGDAAEGEKTFRKCASCHAVGEGAKVKVGPPLTDIIGRTAGTYEGMRYGDDLVAAGAAGLVWDGAEMFAYLEDPRKYLRAKLDDKKARSKMAFKLRKAEDRADVIAYLESLKPAE